MKLALGAAERVAVWVVLAMAVLVVLRLDRRVAALEQRSGADRAAATTAPTTVTAAPIRAAEPDVLRGQEIFVRLWFPKQSEIAEQQCWGATERRGKRVPGALWFEVTLDASGAVTAAEVDLRALEGFAVPPELVDCIARMMKALRFPVSRPQTARIQVDRKRVD